MADIYEEKITHNVTIDDAGIVSVRRTTRVYKNGNAFGAPAHHRTVTNMDGDLTKLPLKAGEIGEAALDELPAPYRRVIEAYWQEPEVVAKYEAVKAELAKRENSDELSADVIIRTGK